MNSKITALISRIWFDIPEELCVIIDNTGDNYDLIWDSIMIVIQNPEEHAN